MRLKATFFFDAVCLRAVGLLQPGDFLSMLSTVIRRLFLLSRPRPPTKRALSPLLDYMEMIRY